jgi:rfaE bifunctional protein nucleotidyltransferase chain/domain
MTVIYTLKELEIAIATHPEQWRPLVFTNGCFDLLHVGHVRYLSAAKTYGKTLVVGLNSDQSVRQIKPPKAGLPPRPIIPESQRAEVIAALKSVDGVVIFPQTTATHLIKILKPDIYIKGGDYTLETLPESTTVQAYGGKIEFIKVEIPTSTSGIIEYITRNKL